MWAELRHVVKARRSLTELITEPLPRRIRRQVTREVAFASEPIDPRMDGCNRMVYLPRVKSIDGVRLPQWAGTFLARVPLPARFVDVCLTAEGAGQGRRVHVETLQERQRGPRARHELTGEAAKLAFLKFGDDVPLCVLLDRLTDAPHEVSGLEPADVWALADAIRERGGWFTKEDKEG